MVVLAWLLLIPAIAWAGKHAMIPAGQEPRVRELVDTAIAEARAQEQLPIELDDAAEVGFAIDRDRIRVDLAPGDERVPRLLVFHPEALPELAAERELAPGVVLECGPLDQPVACTPSQTRAWIPLASHVAAARAPMVEQLWRVEESFVSRDDEPEAVAREPWAVWLDRAAMLIAAALGLGLVGANARSRREPPDGRVEPREVLTLLGLIALFVAATLTQTSLLPLHEHNSFIDRSDCAINETCVEDPAGGAWSMTTLHAYGLLLSALPHYRPASLAALSLGLSIVALVLLWALTRRVMATLGRPDLASVAGLAAVACLATTPVAWRLAGSGTFWPWTCCWLLTAALAGLWAAEVGAREQPSARAYAGLGWLLATLALGFASASNLVCLSLAPLFVLAPACWSAAVEPHAWRRKLGRGLAGLALALGVLVILVGPDYMAGFARGSRADGLAEFLDDRHAVLAGLRPLIAYPSLVTPIWALAGVGGVTMAVLSRVRSRAWRALGRGGLILLPLAYAYLAPAVVLGVAAGELVGSGYPVGFINHHYLLILSAIAVGLGLAGMVAAVERRWPDADAPSWRRWSVALPSGATIAALALASTAGEGWRMATGERVLERELVALERSYASLPEHDLLVLAPRSLPRLIDTQPRWDPIEVVFPVGFYAAAMREDGREPAAVVPLDRIPAPVPEQRILFYVGSSLRSFQPDEIAAGVVPDELERPELTRLREVWIVEPALEFELETTQHEAISLRLGADRAAKVELGFYWLRPRD